MTPARANAIYRGRFAPTPSGPLHLGSLLTALASWLDARAARGRWLLRIDDLDRARCPAEAEPTILRQLEAHGLTWDETPRRQSAHLAEYEAALEVLGTRQRLFACTCTRAMLAKASLDGPDGPVYPGTCRAGNARRGPQATRFRIDDGLTRLDDSIQGACNRSNARDIGDFIVRRNDGIPGYHLACTVDEIALNVTHVVRGADLLGSTFCQLQLFQELGAPPPAYGHLPVLIDSRDGHKLSKQNHASPVDARHAGDNLLLCLSLLGQDPPPVLERGTAGEILDWALANWGIRSVPGRAELALHPGMSYIYARSVSGILR